MLEFHRSDESEAETDVASTSSQVVVAAGQQGGARPIELKRPFPRFVQMKILQGHITSHAKPRPARHAIGQARQVGPNILVELTDNKISPVAAGAFKRGSPRGRAATHPPPN